MIEINIARDFMPLPGPRYRDQGPGSGQQFLEEHLRPAFLKAREAGEQIVFHLDGVKYGYPTSFLEEAFGGLSREFGGDVVQKILVFESASEPMLDYEIRHYIKHAMDTRGTGSRAAILRS